MKTKTLTAKQIERRVYSVPEFAKMLGIDKNTAYDLVKAAGHIAGVPAIRVTEKRTVFSRELVDALFSAQLDQEAADAA